MAATIQKVRPGDPIAAALMNTLIDEILGLRARVEQLEKTGISTPVQITSLVGSLRVGEILEVHGTGFSVPPELNVVKVGTTQVENFVSVSPTLLRFYIPPVDGAPLQVTLSVTNARGGSDSSQFYVQKQFKRPLGRLVFGEDVANEGLGVIQPGKEYTFRAMVTSQTDVAEQYVLRAAFTDASGVSAAAWAAAAKIVDSVGLTLSTPPEAGASAIQTTQSRRLDPGVPVPFGVRLTVPAGATSISVVLSAVSVNNPNSSELQITPLTFKVQTGVAPKPSDSRVMFARADFGPFSTARAVVEDDVEIIEVPYNGSSQLGFSLTFQDREGRGVGGMYRYDAVLEPEGPSPWTIDKDLLSPSFVTSGGSHSIGVILTLNAPAGPGGTHPEARTLIVKSSRRNTPEDMVESFLRVPIRGYTPPTP